MGLIARQSFKSATVTYIGIFVGILSQVFIYPIAFSIEEYGEIQFIIQTAMFFTPILLLGASYVLTKYYSIYEHDEKKKQSLYGMVFLALSLTLLTYLILGIVLYDKIAAFAISKVSISQYSILILILIGFVLPFRVLASSISAIKGRIAVPSLLENAFKVILPVAALLYFYEYIDFSKLLFLLFFSFFIVSLLSMVYAFTLDKIRPILRVKEIRKQLDFNPIGTFAILSLFAGIGATLANQIDVVMITAMKGTYENGLYAWSLFIANAIAVPSTLIGAVAMPMIATYWKDNDLPSINKLYQASSSSLLVLALILFFSFWISIDEFFLLMPKGDEFSVAKYIILLLGLSKVVDLAFGLNSQILSISDHYKWHLVFLIGSSIVNVFLNWLLIPIYGVEGCGVATLASVLLFNISKYLFLKAKYNLSPFSWSSLSICLLATILACILHFLPSTGYTLLDLISKSFLFFTSFAFVSYKFSLAPEINAFVNKQLLRLKLKPFD